MSRDILDKDLSVPEIAGQPGINRKTARKYMNSNEVPHRKAPRCGRIQARSIQGQHRGTDQEVQPFIHKDTGGNTQY